MAIAANLPQVGKGSLSRIERQVTKPTVPWAYGGPVSGSSAAAEARARRMDLHPVASRNATRSAASPLGGGGKGGEAGVTVARLAGTRHPAPLTTVGP